MHTPICELLGIKYPIVGFTPHPAVVEAISKAGGLGVLGAVSMTPEALDDALTTLDTNLGDLPYGVDVIMPSSTVETESVNSEELLAALRAKIPAEHRAFVEDLLDRFGVPPLPAGSIDELPNALFSNLAARAALDVAFAHRPRLIANALGTFPDDVIARSKAAGVLTAALAGKVSHAQAHVASGIDIVVSTAYEAAGHTGDISGMVLHAEIAEAIAPAPVLASGAMATGRQIAAAVALGAQGAWCGSAWLTTTEFTKPDVQLFRGFVDARERYVAASSSDTVRTRWASGKPARLLRTQWSDAWETEAAPGYLPMPLQGLLVDEAQARIAGADRTDLAFMPAGQVIGMLNEIRPTADVIADMVREYDEVVHRIASTA